MDDDLGARVFAQEVVARDLVQRADAALRRAGIDWLPLKGLWLHLEGVYEGFEQRPMSDVDVLVLPRQYRAAREALRAAGFVETKEMPGETALVLDRGGFALDLHEHLFRPPVFELPSEELFARAGETRVVDGLRVRMPNPLDGFAHLVGHFIRGGRGARDEAHCRDFSRILDHYRVSPEEVAAHLARTGTDRASRFCLPVAARRTGDRRLNAILDHLAPDPLGMAIARIVDGAQTSASVPQSVDSIFGLLLAQNLGRGVRGIGTQVRYHVLRKLEARGSGRTR